MKVLKKTGQILLCPVPMIVMVLLQSILISLCMVVLALFIGPDTLETFFMDHYMEFLTPIQAVSLIVFALWYFLAYCMHRKIPQPRDVFTKKDVFLLLLLGFAMYGSITILLVAISILSPDLLAEYEQLITESGLAELTFLSTLATLILAPLSEELVFRGITQKLALKAFGSFRVANIVQALLFGIAHMNLVQGLYAFLLGLILGSVCHRFRSIYASILLHLSFNFFGTYLAALLGYIPLPEEVISLFLLAVGLPLTWYCLKSLQLKYES